VGAIFPEPVYSQPPRVFSGCSVKKRRLFLSVHVARYLPSPYTLITSDVIAAVSIRAHIRR
jgi:hypothetical protein